MLFNKIKFPFHQTVITLSIIDLITLDTILVISQYLLFCGKWTVSTLITIFYESYSFIKAFHRPIEENYLRYKRNKGSFKLYVSIITIGNGSSLYFTCWQRAYSIPASIKLVPTGNDVELKNGSDKQSVKGQ